MIARRRVPTVPAVPALMASTLAATLLVGTPAAQAAPAPPAGLPGTGELSALARARPADLVEAERQFVERTPARYRDQEPAWAPCPADRVQLPGSAAALECATVLVPRDWNDPQAGEPLSIAIARPVRDGERPARSVITNPGGPGGAGLDLAASLSRQPALAGTEVIGLDVRGTGASTPVLCDLPGAGTGTGPDVRDRSPEALAANAAAMAATARGCQSDPLSRFVNTEQTVADIDLVRDALDRETIDWVGYSGGTWVGTQYMTYFPARVGRFVLDSTVDVTAPFEQIFAGNQPAAFQRRFEVDFAAWAGEHHRLFHLGTDAAEVTGTYESLRAAYAARPLELPALGITLDGTVIDLLITQAMYSKTSFESLAWLMTGLRAVDAARTWAEPAVVDRMLAGLTGRIVDLLPAAPVPSGDVPPHALTMAATFQATVCNDTAWTKDQAAFDAYALRTGPRYPLLGWGTNRQPCAHWDRAPLTLPLPDGRDLPPVLLVQTERDAPTSVEGARRTHAALPTSRMVLVTDDGDHGVYAAAGNACVDAVVDAFLTTGVVPDDDVECATTGIPAPGAFLLGNPDLREAVRG
ncbi:alpha/beta hydrolase [Kineococcus gynurae]|uniref:Alpha/beta hydrolase n=1 Tax=Kineococcus gynurae TaxID=452979 RepID=A0ABV5LMS3_9ACTN